MKALGKKNKIIIIFLIALMVTITAVSLALWDMSGVSAVSGETARFANAQIGDTVNFGTYYQDADGVNKTPIEWLVVDKDEERGQLTLLSKHVLAGGSYWGNWFYNAANSGGQHSAAVGDAPAGIPYNQSWADSTLRAWLNNLERTDVHGDKFTLNGIQSYSQKVTASKVIGASSGAFTYTYQHSDLKHSVGYSNKNIWTGLNSEDGSDLAANSGLYKRHDNTEVYYKRPRNSERPAVNGFLDEAFTQEEQERIVPRVIPGQECRQWPNSYPGSNKKITSATTVDKIWVPSTEELNIKEGADWNGTPDDGIGGNNWSAGSDSASSGAFAFFKQFQSVESLSEAIRATGTEFDRNPRVGNYSIPLDVANDNISSINTQNNQSYVDYWGNKGTRYYWTRTPASYWSNYIGSVHFTGAFNYHTTDSAAVGARPALILSYL